MDAIIKVVMSDCPYGVRIVFRTNGKLVEPSKRGKLDMELIIKCLLFADDLVIVSDSKSHLEECLTKFDITAGSMGLTVAIKKTKVMEVGPSDPKWKVLLNFQEVEKVEYFDYLGSRFDKECDIGVEIQRRITKAGGAFASLYNPLWRQKSIPITTKMHVYNVIVIPCLLYVSETWATRSEHISRLESFQTKCLRNICGISKVEHKRNLTVRELTSQPRIESIITRNRLRWLGHCQRMDDKRMPKQVIRSWIEGSKRSRGRPCKRWLECIHEDLEFMELKDKDWQDSADNRNVWRSACIKAADKLGKIRDTKEEKLYKEKKKQMNPLNKTHQCEACNMAFTSVGGLKRHIAWKHKTKIKCPKCSKELTSDTAMKQHVKLHK